MISTEGTSIYDVRKIFGFLDPLVTVTNQLILFLSSAFWGPSSPPSTADVIYGRAPFHHLLQPSLARVDYDFHLQIALPLNHKRYSVHGEREVGSFGISKENK